jgi:hypothetical protein
MAKFIIDQTVRLVVDAETEGIAVAKAAEWRAALETRQFDLADEFADVGEVVPVTSDQFPPVLRELADRETRLCLREAASEDEP